MLNAPQKLGASSCSLFDSYPVATNLCSAARTPQHDVYKSSHSVVQLK